MLLVIDWLLMIGLSVAFAVAVGRRPARLQEAWDDPRQATAWGLVSMGVLSVGGATLTVLGVKLALIVDLALWLPGTAVGLIAAVGFARRLLRGGIGDPAFVWGLPLVAPMVSATTGAVLATHTLALHARSASRPAWLAVAHGYGWVMLSLGLPLLIWATVVTVRGWLRRMPFTPAWWSLTFPLGTLSLGTHLMATTGAAPLLHGVARGFALALVGTWTTAALGAVDRLVSDRRPR